MQHKKQMYEKNIQRQDMTKFFHSRGKLLLTGEYAVLDGALSLAFPTRLGQSLCISETNQGFSWKSFDFHKKVWFEHHELTFDDFKQNTTLSTTAETLLNILNTAVELNPTFATQLIHCQIETHLEFEREWGLGTSSTLINNIAQWAGVNPFELLFKSFGGSGYDIACAMHKTPILYKLTENRSSAYPLQFLLPQTNQLFFVYLNKKQNSKEGIALYKSIKRNKKNLVSRITEITENIIRTTSLPDFCQLIDNHEQIIADFLKIPTVKETLFRDFSGSIKSLGAWGGDFVLAVGERNYVFDYFHKKGFSTVVPFQEMVHIEP